jgi:putative membrane protein
MWDGSDGMGWWMLLGGIWFVLFWVVVAWAVATIVSKLGPGPTNRSVQSETPLDIAKRRYASGEISREEYEQLRRDLQ